VQFEATVPTFEDKVAQRAVSMVLEAIYEQDYLPCSYGFRPGRSAHQALNSLQQEIWSKRLYWVLDIDYASTSIQYHTPTCGRFSTNESKTASSDG
jgi:retron-type reverse transcriptase